MGLRRAFTLIELLVVVAIIVILIAMLVPGLEKAMDAAQRTKCMSHTKALLTAWRVYATDNNQQMVGASTFAANHDWVLVDNGQVNTVMFSGSDPTLGNMYVTNNGGVYGYNSNTGGGGAGDTSTSEYNEDYQRQAIDQRPFYEYVNALEAYKCPTDPRARWLRSYSINDRMGGDNWGGESYFNIGNVQSSSAQMVFIEENDKRGFNQGSWALKGKRNGNGWVDPTADFHFGVVNLSFADGHAESYKYQNEDTKRHVAKGAFFYPTRTTMDDFLFMRNAYESGM